MGCVSIAAQLRSLNCCNTANNPWTKVVLFLESSHVFLILYNPFTYAATTAGSQNVIQFNRSW